jgi:hypothetical protein
LLRSALLAQMLGQLPAAPADRWAREWRRHKSSRKRRRENPCRSEA